jgi:transcriptional regulator with XRE-family HTH domain
MFRGDRLKALRKEKKLTQVQLGELFELSDAAINRHERGINQPDISMLIKYAEYFNVSADYLLGLSDNKNR